MCGMEWTHEMKMMRGKMNGASCDGDNDDRGRDRVLRMYDGTNIASNCMYVL